MSRNNSVAYNYNIGDIVYFVHEGKAYKGRIQEVSINIVDAYKDDDGYDCISVRTKYRVRNIWVKENELYDDLDFFNKFVNPNLKIE